MQKTARDSVNWPMTHKMNNEIGDCFTEQTEIMI